MSSPRPWGCFRMTKWYSYKAAVFPTPVGVFLSLVFSPLRSLRLPHARGGVSSCFVDRCRSGGSSPRPWGCFHTSPTRRHCTAVFPTPVGVFLLYVPVASMRFGLPHARGGVSRIMPSQAERSLSSPRPWGCFCGHGLQHLAVRVFPTPVGVFPGCYEVWIVTARLPHARGGVSGRERVFSRSHGSSPRPWGCFPVFVFNAFHLTVFPTPVGVFLLTLYARTQKNSLPHARGGVSN